MGADMRARQAREDAQKAAREADRAEAHPPGRWGWKAMEGPRSRPRRSPNASTAGWAGGAVTGKARNVVPLRA